MLKKTEIILSFTAAILVFPGISSAGIRIDFDRDNRTYNWLMGFDYSIYESRFNFRTSFDGQSNLIKGGTDRWQENASADFYSELSVYKNVSFLTSGEYTINGLKRRRVRSSELAMGLSVKPFRNFEIKPKIHADSKKRSEQGTGMDDQGVGYGFMAGLLPSQYRGGHIDAGISYDNTSLTNIPSETSSGFLNSDYRFRKSDTVYVSIRGSETAKKFYGPGGSVESITKQIKQEREGDLIISISLPLNLRLKFDGNARLARYLYREGQLEDSTSAQRDNSVHGEGYEISLGGAYRHAAMGDVKYRWSSASQDYQGLTLDQDTDTGEMSFHGIVLLSDNDSLTGNLVFGVSSFSNPSRGLSQEDWDKKTILFNGNFTHVFNGFFSAGLSGGASSFHQIYISGARSANNGRNDTYVLTPSCLWKPAGRLNVIQTFDIQANYITFDFDRKRISTKNRIFRRASSKTSFEVKISDNLKIRQAYFYRYEDYGQLIWEDGWQQAVSWDRRRNGLETEFDYNVSRVINLKPFFSWEKTGDYDHRLELNGDPQEEASILRALKEEQVKMIFRVETAFKWSDRGNILMDISYRLRKFNDRPAEENDYMRISMEYLF